MPSIINPTEPEGPSWKARALMASRQDPLMAAIIRVLVGRPAFARDSKGALHLGVIPGFGPKFRITEDSLVTATQVDSNGDMTRNVILCDTADLRDNLNRLADAITASDAERAELFAAFRACVLDDMRAITAPDDPLSRVQRKL